MDEIIADEFTWAWFSEPHGYDFNGHLVHRAEGNLCIDPVQPTDACLAEIARMGSMTILLTNRTHSPAADLVRGEACANCTIWISTSFCSAMGRRSSMTRKCDSRSL